MKINFGTLLINVEYKCTMFVNRYNISLLCSFNKLIK